MIEIRCDFCGAKTAKEFNHKVEIKPWYNPRIAGHVYHREFDCCEECAKAIEHRLIGIENNYLWRGKDPNRRYKNWDLSINRTKAIPKVDYENRLKADMIAMLEEIESMFWELTKNKYDMQILYEKADDFEIDFNSFIQRKIDSIKEK